MRAGAIRDRDSGAAHFDECATLINRRARSDALLYTHTDTYV